MKDITIRDATEDDIQFIAKCTMAAIGLYDFRTQMTPGQKNSYRCLAEICGMNSTLYSYRKSRIASVGDTAVGCLISYRGESYAEARKITFGIAEKTLGTDLTGTEAETGEGEYYLDTMAVIPAFRGYEIGKKLLIDGIDRGKQAGYSKITLIVGKRYAHLRKYYAEVGFRELHEMQCFGDTYIKMVFCTA